MSETPPEPQPGAEPGAQDGPQEPKPKSLEDMLSVLDEDSRKAVLAQVSKARTEAAGYRAKLREAEPLVKKAREIEAANQTAQEKAEAAARQAEERAAAAVRRIASAEIRAALTGVVPDPAAVAEDLDLSRFIDAESGDVRPEAVEALKAKYAALAPPSGPRAPAPNPAQGAGGQAKTLAEIIAEAEKASTGSRQDTRAIMRLKSQQLVNQNKG